MVHDTIYVASQPSIWWQDPGWSSAIAAAISVVVTILLFQRQRQSEKRTRSLEIGYLIKSLPYLDPKGPAPTVLNSWVNAMLDISHLIDSKEADEKLACMLFGYNFINSYRVIHELQSIDDNGTQRTGVEFLSQPDNQVLRTTRDAFRTILKSKGYTS